MVISTLPQGYFTFKIGGLWEWTNGGRSSGQAAHFLHLFTQNGGGRDGGSHSWHQEERGT